MRVRSFFPIVAVVLLCWGGYRGASSVIMQCDVGGCGPVQAGWIVPRQAV